jgi:hypothetical protein
MVASMISGPIPSPRAIAMVFCAWVAIGMVF